MQKIGRPRKSNPSKHALYMREYNKKKRKTLPESFFWDKIIRGFNKFLEPPKIERNKHDRTIIVSS